MASRRPKVAIYKASAMLVNSHDNTDSVLPTISSPKPAKQRRPAHQVRLAYADELITRELLVESASVMVGKHEFERNEKTKRYARTNGENSREGSQLGTYDDMVIVTASSRNVNCREPRVHIVENPSQEEDLDAG
jgi:hypothetical protein